MMKPNRGKITLSLITIVVINYCVSQSSVFPVLYGERSSPEGTIRFFQLDYNEVKKLVAAGGDA